MEPSQRKVVDSLNASLLTLESARASISTAVPGYSRIIKRHDELKKQVEELRDGYAMPRDQPVEPIKHPLLAVVEAVLPDRPARFDVMRAYDQGVRESAAALKQALEEGEWVNVKKA